MGPHDSAFTSSSSVSRHRLIQLFWAIGLVAVALAAVVPISVPRRLQREAEAAEAYAASLRVPLLAEPQGLLENSPTPMLAPHRAPEPMIWPVLDERLDRQLSTLTPSWPDPYCLAVAVDGRLVHTVGTTPQIPASVQKVLTAAALLEVVDPSDRLTTIAATDAEVTPDGVIGGDLYIIGGGDPMLATQEYADAYSRQPQLRTPIEDLADAIVAAGITRIDGRLVGDEGRYDEVRYVETWPARYRQQHNSGPLSALTVNDGFTRWDPSRSDASQPALHAVDVLRRLLRDRGVSIGGGVAVASAPDGATPIAEIASPTMAEMVAQMLRESDNNTAESLLKELGLRVTGDPTTAAGAAAVEQLLTELVPDETPPVVADGSGLDRGNGVTCRFLLTLLDTVGRDSIIGEGLAIAATNGTLGHRFTDTELAGILRAKTGLLNNVNGLAGFIDKPDGGHVTFVQLLNGIPLNSALGFDLQLELAIQLAAHLDPVDPREFAP